MRLNTSSDWFAKKVPFESTTPRTSMLGLWEVLPIKINGLRKWFW